MDETTQFMIGAHASCTDGVCGEVIYVVVDPVARAVTHIVVEPKHRQGLGRLVPLALVDATTDTVVLRCSQAEFEKLDFAQETKFLPVGSEDYAGYGLGQMLSWPYYGLAGPIGNVSHPIINDKVPLGEVAVHRGDQVHATDGAIGQVQGLIIDPGDHHVTHVLLQEGHLWGRKEVAIPINTVTRVDDGIQLSITKQEVEDLPPVDINHPNR